MQQQSRPVSLVKNLKTGYLSPACHVVHDDSFETVYSPDDAEPPQWEHLCVFERFELEFESNPPPLPDDWLTPEELALKRAARHRQSLKQGRKLWQDSATKETREDFNYQPPKPSPRQVPSVSLRESPKHPNPVVTPATEPGSLIRTSPLEPIAPAPAPAPAFDAPSSPMPIPERRYPLRANRNQGVDRLQPDPSLKSYDSPKIKQAKSNLSRFYRLSMVAAIMGGWSGVAGHQVIIIKEVYFNLHYPNPPRRYGLG